MRSPIFRRIKKYLFLYIVLVLVLYIVCEFQNYTIDGSVMNQPPQQIVLAADKKLSLSNFSLKDSYNSPLTKIYLFDADGKRRVVVLKKSLILNKYRVFWSLEVTPQMHELAACDSFFPITRI